MLGRERLRRLQPHINDIGSLIEAQRKTFNDKKPVMLPLALASVAAALVTVGTLKAIGDTSATEIHLKLYAFQYGGHVEENTSRIITTFTVKSQNLPKDGNVLYVLNGFTNKLQWYQLFVEDSGRGVAAAGTSPNRYYLGLEVLRYNNDLTKLAQIYPETKGAEVFVGNSIRSGDEVQLSLSISNGNVTAEGIDVSTKKTLLHSVFRSGVLDFLGARNPAMESINRRAYVFTGPMDETHIYYYSNASKAEVISALYKQNPIYFNFSGGRIGAVSSLESRRDSDIYSAISMDYATRSVAGGTTTLVSNGARISSDGNNLRISWDLKSSKRQSS